MELELIPSTPPLHAADSFIIIVTHHADSHEPKEEKFYTELRFRMSEQRFCNLNFQFSILHHRRFWLVYKLKIELTTHDDSNIHEIGSNNLSQGLPLVVISPIVNLVIIIVGRQQEEEGGGGAAAAAGAESSAASAASFAQHAATMGGGWQLAGMEHELD